MTEFIEKFEQTKEAALADQRSARATIVGLLEHISSGLEAQHHIPDRDRMRVGQKEFSRTVCCGFTFFAEKTRLAGEDVRQLPLGVHKRKLRTGGGGVVFFPIYHCSSPAGVRRSKRRPRKYTVLTSCKNVLAGVKSAKYVFCICTLYCNIDS